MVVDSRVRMNNFVMGVSDSVVNVCRSTMLIPSMNISSLMVHAEQIEEQKLKKMNREVKRARTGDKNFSNVKSDGQGRQRFKQSSSSACPMVNKDSVLNPKPQKGYDKIRHQLKNYPTLTAKGREDKQNPPSGSHSNAKKQNHFYALREDHESSPDVVTGMLQVFSIDAYTLLDPGATLSFATPFMAMKFEILPEVLLELFSVSTPVEDEKKELVREVHRLAQLGVQLVDSPKGDFTVHSGSESSFVVDVKSKQGLDPILI
ncbi:uncharacterized protein LOC125828844 [Solanum verrucosum]|uniref:uncharacterized protein LOC125828844 n=1 Tax=Solanum verrucosum TaxID=315347 RepID=UPI0020D0D49E|nr:uncharacterized protein LOC125828844 [Solanum verrucosum]